MTYVIRIKREFFGPSTDSILMRRGHDVARFETRAEAQSAIDAEYDRPYYTQHNETGHPEYRIVREDKLPQFLAWHL